MLSCLKCSLWQRCDLSVGGGNKVRCDWCPLVSCQEFAPSDEELEAYRKGEEWDPKLAEQRRRVKVNLLLIRAWSRNFLKKKICHFLSVLQEMAALEEATSSQTKKPETCPNSNYKDKYSHLIGTSAAKDAAHTLEANRTYGCGECRSAGPGRHSPRLLVLVPFTRCFLSQFRWPTSGTLAP